MGSEMCIRDSYSVCADVMLINPPGVVGEHNHSISSKEVNLSIGDTD